MEDMTLAAPTINNSSTGFFNCTLNNRGVFSDTLPRIVTLPGSGVMLTASQRNASAPHSQMFNISLDPQIRSGTHAIPGPMIRSLVLQERNDDIVGGDPWKGFMAISGTMRLELDQSRKLFKATCTFTLKNKTGTLMNGTAEMNVAYREWAVAL
ncbi:hypothetical protein KJF94_06390 [Pseudomonas hormoni]|uniref:Uncharacterized protein n=1 Tax=Pseudomonas hormoni TaxID=3093767 RepID=A0ABX8F0H4_9PSED|nr:hypothetical protein [Pseudomonas hormoni]QVW25210.1 hypothetical protein KJF94_06390 [Pseudomonas hormoni]